jgi:hypothetical protein
LNGGPTVGQLKTSLSHVELENEQLKKKMARLERENRSIENRLVQEQIDNGNLTARLDDARNLLRDRGIEPDVKLGSRARGEGNDESAPDDTERRTRTLPAARPVRQRRKAPFARIPGPGKAAPEDTDEPDAPAGPSERRDAKKDRTSPLKDDDPDRHSFRSGPLRWLPVADSGDDSTIQIR